MKTIITILAVLISIALLNTTQAQSTFINYQGVASDGSGTIMANTGIAIQIALKFGTTTNTAAYIETHNVATDANGVFSLQIGNGTAGTGVYNELVWAEKTFATISIDGSEIGTTELHAVPYALHAANAISKINDLTDGKSDSTGSSLFLGIEAGANDDGTNNANVSIGFRALFSNTTGRDNTATGNSALLNTTTGRFNTATGRSALFTNIDGENNTATGYFALLNNTKGSFNTANGFQALEGNTTGSLNTATGGVALSTITTGSNNIGIGFNAQVADGTASNQIRIGNSNITHASIQVAWDITSDKRWKEKIRKLPYGLDFVMQLQPVDYIRKNNTNKTREMGFIAQDVEKVLENLEYKDQGFLNKDNKGYISLRYNDLIAVLTKAVQEQQKIIETLTLRIKKLEGNTQQLAAKN